MSGATSSRVWCAPGMRSWRSAAAHASRTCRRRNGGWSSGSRPTGKPRTRPGVRRADRRAGRRRRRRLVVLHAGVRTAAGRCAAPARPSLLNCGRIWVHGPAERVPVTEDEPRTAYGEYGTQGGDRSVAAAGDARGRRPERRAAPRAHQRPAGRSSRPPATSTRRLAAAGDRRAARAARPRARRPAPRARRRRRAGLPTGADPPGRDRIELPRGLRAGDDAPRARRRSRRLVRPRAGARPRRLARVRAPGRAEHAPVTRDHAERSVAASIARARDVLGYPPRYRSLQALHEALRRLVANGHVDVGGQDF